MTRLFIVLLLVFFLVLFIWQLKLYLSREVKRNQRSGACIDHNKTASKEDGENNEYK